MKHPKSKHDHAQAYAAASYPVFPCNGKKPATHNGCNGATTDRFRIDRWWQRNPDANIGLPCGNEMLVLDIDVKTKSDGTVKDGFADLGELISTLGPLPDGPRSRTGSGEGEHRFFRAPGIGISGRTEIGGTGIDIRTGKQYTIAPPSVHPETGLCYEWINPLIEIRNGGAVKNPLPELPKAWIEWLASVAPKGTPRRRPDSSTARCLPKPTVIVPPGVHYQGLLDKIQERLPQKNIDIETNDISFEELKDEAEDRWTEIVTALCPDPGAILNDGNTVYKRCPVCEEQQKFKLYEEFESSGKCRCHHCHRNGAVDGIGLIAWALQLDMFEDKPNSAAKNLIWYALEAGLVD